MSDTELSELCVKLHTITSADCHKGEWEKHGDSYVVRPDTTWEQTDLICQMNWSSGKAQTVFNRDTIIMYHNKMPELVLAVADLLRRHTASLLVLSELLKMLEKAPALATIAVKNKIEQAIREGCKL